MNYLDSNVFIYALLYDGKKAEQAKNLLSEMVRGNCSCVTSSLALDEIIWVMMRESCREKGLQIGGDILHLPNLKILDVTKEHILSSISFMQKYPSLKPRDAIHLAVSTAAGVYSFVTDDSDFDCISEITRISLQE